MVASEPSVAVWPEALLKTVFWMASSDVRVLVAKAHADGVGTAVGNQRIVGGNAIENGRRIFGNFGRREAEARRNDGIDLEVGGRAADGVVDAILTSTTPGILPMASPTRGPSCVSSASIVGEDLDLDWLRRIGQVADHVLQHLDEFDIELGLGGLDLLREHLPSLRRCRGCALL